MTGSLVVMVHTWMPLYRVFVLCKERGHIACVADGALERNKETVTGMGYSRGTIATNQTKQ